MDTFAHSARIQEHDKATQGRRESLKAIVDKYVPVPDFFYDVKKAVKPIGSSPIRVRLSAYVLYLLTISVFIGAFAYYSTSDQRVHQESMVTSDWHKPGFTCRPLQNITIHGLSTDWTYDECLVGISAPNANNVEVTHGGGHLNLGAYNFTDKGGVVLLDLAPTFFQKVQNESWKLPGYSCHPNFPYDNHFNIGMNYSECVQAIRPPSATNVVQMGEFDNRYYPLGVGNGCFPDRRLGVSGKSRLDAAKKISASRYGTLSNVSNCLNAYAAFYMNGFKIWTYDPLNTWSRIVSLPADAHGDFYIDYVCDLFKHNGNGFRCKLDKEVARSQMIQKYATEYPPEKICALLKQNSPFQCTRTVEVPTATRLSLAVAASQAVFAVGGMLFVLLLRKLESRVTDVESHRVDDFKDSDLCALVRKHDELINDLMKKYGESKV